MYFTLFSQAQRELRINELHIDLQVLEDITLGVSPGIDKNDSELITQKINESISILKEPMNTVDFFELLSDLNLPNRVDEHGNITLPGEILQKIFKDAKLFPIPVVFVGNELMVNIKGTAIPFGSIIESINEKSIQDISRRFTDNFTNNYNKMKVERQLSYLFLILNGSSESYEVIYRPKSDLATQKKVLVDGVDLQTIEEMRKKRVYPQNREKLRRLMNTHYLPSRKTFIFQLNSFSWDDDYPTGRISAFYSEEEEFEASFENIFDQIRESGAEKLIIDLRYNSGGNTEIPAKLYSFLARKPFYETINLFMPDFQIPHPEYVTQIGGRAVEDESEVSSYIRNLMDDYQPSDSGFVQPYFNNVKREPHSNTFNGDVYLLTGGRTVSASAYFTAMFKAYGRGTIIGRRTGGSHRAVTAGRILKYRLPNSGIEVYAPLMLVTYSDEIYQNVPEYFIEPDITIGRDDRYLHMINGEDPELLESLKIISKNN